MDNHPLGIHCNLLQEMRQKPDYNALGSVLCLVFVGSDWPGVFAAPPAFQNTLVRTGVPW